MVLYISIYDKTCNVSGKDFSTMRELGHYIISFLELSLFVSDSIIL